MGASFAAGFDNAAGGLKPRFSAADIAAERAPARVTLPAAANAALHLEDASTGTAVDVTMQGAAAAAGQTTDGYVVYAAASATGSTVVQRAIPAGTEDFVALDTKPVATQVAYTVALGAGAAGLRLVGGALEVLDASGTPRLRVAPPFIVGSDGVQTDATLAVTGCAVDTNPAPPWGRAVTAPGANSCQVQVAWPATGVAYPAILDPRWTTTATMGVARQDHTMTVLANGKVLVTGGRSSTGTTGLSSAELYDQTTQTWSPTSSMAAGRFMHRATQLATGSNSATSGKILISGGLNGTTSSSTFQLYDPTAGTWSSSGNMNAARHGHTATLLADGKVLASGGLNGSSVLVSAAIYNPASGIGSWAATTGPLPPSGQKNHTAVLLQTANQQLNNKVLLVGGNSGTGTLDAVYLFDPAQSAFSTLQAMPNRREGHTMTVLSNGKVLVAGGKDGSATLSSAVIFDPGFGPGSWSQAGTMTSARSGHTATLLPASIVADGQVLVVGGNNGSGAVTSAELFSGTSTWTATPAMSSPASQGHTAAVLANNMVLICGGLNGSTVLNNARLYDASFGLGCSSASQCPSGNCVNGVCCDTACNGGCGACNLAGHLGTCTALSNTTVCRAAAGTCDQAETCNGSSLTCPSDAFKPSSTVCRAAADECDAAESCTGSSAACPNDQLKANGTACTDDGNPCTTDRCNGTATACQHAAGNAGTVCRGAADECDVAEACTGASINCPTDGKKAAGTACTTDNNVCTVDACNGSSVACQHTPGNAGTQCRAAAADCDLPAVCSGSSSTCPANPFKPASTVCRGSAGTCDVAENCTGSSATCPANTFMPPTTVCRAANGQCDVAENCPGNAAACPGDGFAPSSTVCRPANGQCDVAENCPGNAAACPGDGFAPPSTVCRPANGICDVAENCPGNAAACPGDGFAPPSTVCRPANGQCDVAETCPGNSGSCPADALASNGTSCSDGNNCTGPDTCQSGSCTAGANTCSSIAVTQTINTFVKPTMSATLHADTTFVVPGDPIEFTATVTNTGALTNIGGDLRVTNTGSSTFTLRGFTETLEYQAVPSGVWTPFARATYDTAGNVVPETTLQQITFWWFFPLTDGSGATYAPNSGNGNQVTATTIDAGGNAHFGFGGPDMQLPADLVNIIFDPAQSAGIRTRISIDVPSGSPQDASFSLDQAYAGMTGDITDVSAPVHLGYAFAPDHVSQLQSSETSPLAPGASRMFTGIASTPLVEAWPLFPGENESGYLGRIGWAKGGFDPYVRFSGHAQPLDPPDVDGYGQHVGIELPDMSGPQKSGPPTLNAGLTAPYTVSLQNSGNSPAGAFTLIDSVDDIEVPIADLSLPATLAAASTGMASFKAQVPLGRPVGSMTDVATITWQDRKGNLYGPITARFTNTITPGHPEGYLSVDVTTGITDTIGISKPIVVTALDPYGNPAPGVSVHFVVTGDNPRTVDVPTGADGKATFSYSGTVMGNDTVVASATITTTQLTLDPIHVQWAQSVGTPCTGRATPLDIMLVVDVSGSVAIPLSDGKLQAAKIAADRFIDNLTYPHDQVGVITFVGSLLGPVTFSQLATSGTAAKSAIDGGIDSGIACTQMFCPGGSDVAYALNYALDELESPRHRADAQKVVIYIGDGGADNDPTAAIARLRSSGTHTVAFGIGSNIDGVVVRAIADGPNDYFYAPSGAGVDFAFNNLSQDVCRNRAPFVSAGGDQGAYEVRIPSLLTLQGEVHDDGPDADRRLTSEWTLVSGPAPVSFTDATSPVTQVLFGAPGTYVFQLAASDGYLTVIDRATITVDPDPSIAGANLAVALTAPGPLETGQNETLTATLTDNLGVPIRDFAVRVTVAGANPVTTTMITNSAGVATFAYSGAKPGTDMLHATAIGSTFQLDSAFVSLQWIQPASGGAYLTQGWIGAPLDQAKVMGGVSIKLADDVTLTSGTVKYYATGTPADVRVLAPNVSGAPGATLATLDTTLLANGTYVVQLDGTDQAGNQKTSVVLVTVTGDYKPGRVLVELTDFTIPIAGLPITIGRRYDSLEKDQVGDFGYGWSLVVGHPRLEVNPNFGVSVTLPNGRRATFDLSLHPVTDDFNFNVFGGFFGPNYVGEPGVFGKLTQEGGCPMVRYNPANPANPLTCFILSTLAYAPEFYTYTDPYGTAYRMAASGELKSITDRQGNTLSFEANGIVSSTGKSVTFTRDAQGRIQQVDCPAYLPNTFAAKYTYDGIGDLTAVELPPSGDGPSKFQHTYDQHRLLTTKDPLGHAARTSTYYPDGRLATDKDALNNQTSYTYNLATLTNTTTFPDTGVLSQTFDERGLVVSETDQLGHTTTHEYDANRNETTRTNALGEVTTVVYDNHGNQTSVTDPTGTTHTTYNDQNLPVTLTDRMGHVTTIEYDDRGVPSRFSDELGTRFKFTNSEQGLPLTVDDAAGNRAYIEYDAAGNVTARTDWLGRITRATYDEAGHKTSETTARGATTKYKYAPQGWLGQATAPGGDLLFGYYTSYGYDANGNVTSTSDSPQIHGHTFTTYDALNHVTLIQRTDDGTTVTYERDFRGNPTSITDENGHKTKYEYDKTGNLTKTTFVDPAGVHTVSTTRTYDALNRLETLTDERGNTTTYAYDAGCGCSDRVTVVTDPLTHATTTTYDANGRRATVTDANNHVTTFHYDVRGHLTDTDYPDGTTTHEEYDPRGRRISTTDQMGKTTFYGYDDQGQLTSVTDPLSNVTQYAYDLDGNLTSMTDANNHTTTYEYDLRKRKTKRTLPMGQFETFTYNDVDNQLTHTDLRGKTTTMTYDRRDHILTKAPDPSLGEATHIYTYWPTGQRHTAMNASGTTTTTYDFRDRLETKATPAGTLTYGYDDSGNVASIRSSNTNGTDVEYTWNDANQLSIIKDNRLGGATTTGTYTLTNRPSTLSQPNGIGLTYSYDPLDRVTSMIWRRGASPAFGSWAYTHNERGQRLTSADITGRTATYTYDSASRLATETIAGDTRGASFNGALSYLLDGAGNRLSRTSTLAALGNQSLIYNPDDELASDTYDANGNTTSSGGHTFAYDFENRLLSKDAGAVTLQYDCDGDRIAKTANGVTTRYLVDDLNPTGYAQVLEEVVGGAVRTRYTYGASVVSQTQNVSTLPTTSYYGSDAHGNVTFLTDASGGVTDSYDYDAWGNPIAITGSTPNSRLFLGEDFDLDLKLLNLRARQYNPSLGRFETIDPLELRVPTNRLTNRYSYAAGDPLRFIDPLGLVEFAEDVAVRKASSNATVYIYRFFSKAMCYIGITVDPFARELQHKVRLGDPGINLRVMTGFTNRDLAKNAEQYALDKLKQAGLRLSPRGVSPIPSDPGAILNKINSLAGGMAAWEGLEAGLDMVQLAQQLERIALEIEKCIASP